MNFELLEQTWNSAQTHEQKRQWWEYVASPQTRGLFWALHDAVQRRDKATIDRWIAESATSKAELAQFRGPESADLFLAHLLCAQAIIETPDPGSRSVPLEKLREIAERTKSRLGLLRDLASELVTDKARIEASLVLTEGSIACGDIRPATNSVQVPALLAERANGGDQYRGVIGWLVLELVPDGDSSVYPAPALALAEQDDAFRDSERVLCEYLRAHEPWPLRGDIRWRVLRRGDAPPPSGIHGDSLIAAFLFAALCLLDRIPPEKLKWLDLRSIAFKAAADPDGGLRPVGHSYPELLAAACSDLLPRIHTVVIAMDQPWEHFGLAADTLNEQFLCDGTREFHVVRAPSIAEAINLLVVNAQVRWCGIDCDLPEPQPDQVPRTSLTLTVRQKLMEKWVKEKSGYLVEVGGAGEGKTTHLQEMIRDEIRRGRAPIYHLIEHQRIESGNLRNIVACLYYRLLRKYPVPMAAQFHDLDIEQRLQQLLAYLSETRLANAPEPEVIYIDGADQSAASADRPLLPGTLRRLPPGFVCLITARPGLQNWLQMFDQVEIWNWEPLMHSDDIRTYLERQAHSVEPPLRTELIDRIMSIKEPPSFLTVRSCMKALQQTDGDKKLQKELRKDPRPWRVHPEKLVRAEILRAEAKAETRGIPKSKFRGTLGLLAVGRDDLSQHDLRDLGVWEELVTEPVLECAANLFVARSDSHSLSSPYRFYHPGYAREVIKLLNELSAAAEPGCHGRLEDGCARWQELHGTAREYAIRHLQAHSRLAGRHQQAAETLLDFEYLQERLGRCGNGSAGHHAASVFELLDDFQETLFGSISVQDPDLRPQLEALFGLLGAYAPALNGDPTLFVPLAHNHLSWHWNRQTRLGNQIAAAVAKYDRTWLELCAQRPTSFDPEAHRRFPGHRGVVQCVAISNDGKWIGTASYDKTVRIWDAHTGRVLLELAGHQREVMTLAFSPIDKIVATGSLDGFLRLWDAESGKLLRAVPGNGTGILTMAFSGDGQLLAVGRQVGKVGVYDVARDVWLWERQHHDNDVLSVAFSSDERVASGSKDRRVIVWDARTGHEEFSFHAHYTWVKAVLFSPCGHYLVTGGGHGHGEIKFWNAGNGDYQRTIIAHKGGVGALAFSPDGKKLASGSYDETIRVVNPETGDLLFPPLGNGGIVTSLTFSPDGRALASASFHRMALLWDLATSSSESGKPTPWQQVSRGDDPAPLGMAFSADGQILLTGCMDGTLRARATASSIPKGIVPCFSKPVISVAVAEGPGSVACCAGHDIGVWSGRLDEAPRIFGGHDKELLTITISRDGRLIASGGCDKLVMLWEAATSKWLHKFEGHTGAVTSLGFSPNARLLATGACDTRVLLWDVDTRVLRHMFLGHNSTITTLAFAPDAASPILASGDLDGAVRVWNAHTGESIRSLLLHSDEISAIVFSRDGQFLATASLDESVRVWSFATGQQLACLPCPHVARALWFGEGSDILHVADAGGATRIPNTYVVKIQNVSR